MSVEARSGSGRSRVGLALAGGGPGGAIWEVGALRALEEALDGAHLDDLHVYVGVSSGSFLAACLANGLTPSEMYRRLVIGEAADHPFRARVLYTPAFRELLARSLMTPRLVLDAVWDLARNPLDRSLLGSLARLTRALPVGVFDNEPLAGYLREIFRGDGRTDDFRKLDRRLVVVAADLDSGEAVRFGEKGLDHVPISKAVQASTALPGLYPPVLIGDRHYVDGVLLKTVHASVAIQAGADLVLCVNPIVPVDTARAVETGAMRRGRLVNRGLPAVLAQTFRTMIHSRLVTGIASYAPRYPDTDVLLLEPRRDDYRMFFTNIFSVADRRAVCEHAYRSTRRELLSRRKELEHALGRHGLGLRVDVLEDVRREVWRGIEAPGPGEAVSVSARLDHALSRLETLLDLDN